jgi:hypothetical protein
MNKNKPLQRYLSEHERDKYYMSWVAKNGFPKKGQGCICCAELYCIKDCKGINDHRIRLIGND